MYHCTACGAGLGVHDRKGEYCQYCGALRDDHELERRIGERDDKKVVYIEPDGTKRVELPEHLQESDPRDG
jgi:hypothetical protein